MRIGCVLTHVKSSSWSALVNWFLMFIHKDLCHYLFAQSSAVLLNQITYFFHLKFSINDAQIGERDVVFRIWLVPSANAKFISFLFDVSSTLGTSPHPRIWRNNLPLIVLGDWHLVSYQPRRLPSGFYSCPLPPVWIPSFVKIRGFLILFFGDCKHYGLLSPTPNVRL